jgi:5S rRNA maturation endonuclease (ribonuclease M5)
MTGTERRSSVRRTGKLSFGVSKLNGAALGLGAITENHEATVLSCFEKVKGPPAGNPANELATQLLISPEVIDEAMQRGVLTFMRHRKAACWRFGDARNGCLRRLDGHPFKINGQCVKAKAETRGESWHRLIGLDDVVANDRREILLIVEGSKDALAALHFADVEDRLSSIGLVAALGAGVKLLADDVEKFRGRRVRIFGDADATGENAASKIGQQLASVAEEVQIFNLAGLHCEEGSLVKDLFDLTRIDYDAFEANRDLWSITDLDSKGERVTVRTKEHEFLFSPLPLPHVSPESHGFPVYPVSNSQELENELEELAKRNACVTRHTARKRRWKLERDLIAVEKRISRKLSLGELTKTFDKWHCTSRPHLDPEKTRDDYLGAFLAELGKVRVPTGEGEALKIALARVSTSPLPELPGMPDAPESWRRLAALHRELARQSANGMYFLGCRDAAKAHHGLNKDSANKVNRALAQLGVISLVRIGDTRPGGKASEFRYLLPL